MSYLKIIDIPYIMESTNIPINSSVIQSSIQSTYIFNNICFMSKPYIIKTSPKSDIAVI